MKVVRNLRCSRLPLESPLSKPGSVFPSNDSEIPLPLTAFSLGEIDSFGHLMSSGTSMGECCIVAIRNLELAFTVGRFIVGIDEPGCTFVAL